MYSTPQPHNNSSNTSLVFICSKGVCKREVRTTCACACILCLYHTCTCTCFDDPIIVPLFSSDAKVYDVHINSSEIEHVTAFHRSIIPSLEFTLTKGKVGHLSLFLSFSLLSPLSLTLSLSPSPPLSFILFHLIIDC